MHPTRALPLRHVNITSGFWKAKQDLVADQVLPYQWKALNDEIPGAEPSHSVENFRIAAGEKTGEFYGFIFQDSDLGKWIEAAAYSLTYRPDPDLEARIDEAVRLVARCQEPDGYLQTYFSVKVPGKRWTDFAMGHEMYCGGHLMEGAVAYAQATGKTEFLEVMKRYADHLCRTFGSGPGQIRAYDGHPEIELALYKLADVTKDQKYRDLAKFFVDERGLHPEVLDHSKILGWPVDPHSVKNPDYAYYQAHLPVRDQRTAEGHAVRAMYLFTAMTDQRRHFQDPTLDPALNALWRSVVDRRMYVTGGLGSLAHGERFSIDDDAPSDTAYNETCAAIGLVLWAWRMTLVDPRSEYSDVLERALYNGSLAGLSLDGTRYFYVNPLEVKPAVARFRKDHDHVKTQRVEWFGCACCPPNIARTIASFGQYLYSVGEPGLWVHQFATGRAQVPFRGTELVIDQETEYPWEGTITLTLRSVPPGLEAWDLAIRIPDWCPQATVSVNGVVELPPQKQGYAVLNRAWKSGDVVTLNLPMEVRLLRSHPRVRETFGQVAVQRGPLIWCAEEADNGPHLHRLKIVPGSAQTMASPEWGRGAIKLVLPGLRQQDPESEGAFGTAPGRWTSVPVILVPYHLWGNRGEGEMAVWLGHQEE